MKKLFGIFLSSLIAVSSSFACYAAPKTASTKTTKQRTQPALTSVTHPEWSRNAVIYEVNLRQFTPQGTITAFQKQLPRLKELGVDILWFMPIFPISELNRKGELGSYYAVKDYTAVNPEFGTMDQFKEMVKKAHEMGFKVILDWVPNHSGCDNAWVTEHSEWYAKNKEGKMFGPYDWTDVYKFDYSNKNMRAAMTNALKFWIKDVGVDGFRMDVASEVPTDYWNELRPQLDAIKPVFMLAESPAPDLSFKAFDMNYNWPMKDLQNEISRTAGQNAYATEKNTHGAIKTPLAIDSLLSNQASEFARDSYMMNMITNHDLNSWEGTEFDRYGDAVETFAVLTYTLPGMPLIYTGQEVGFDRAFKFFDKDIAPDWTPNRYTEFYTKMNALKHSFSALNAGNGAPVMRYPTQNSSAYVFSRSNKSGGVYVFLNFSGKTVQLDYTKSKPEAKYAVNYFTGKTESFPTSLAPWQYIIYTVK